MMDSVDRFYKAYCARLNWINAELEERESSLLVQQLRLSLLNTQVSAVLLQDYISTSAKMLTHFRQEQEDLDAEREEIANQILSMEKALEGMLDPDLRSFQEETIAATKNLYAPLESLEMRIFHFHSFYIKINLDMAISRLSKIYEGDDADYIYEAFQSFLEYLLSLTPPGWFIGGLKAIKDIVVARRVEGGSADNYVGKLDAFNFSISNWCIITQVLLDSINSKGPVDFARAAKTVQSKTRALLNNKTDKFERVSL